MRAQGFKALSEQGQHDAQAEARQARGIARLSVLLQDSRRRCAVNAAEAEARNGELSGACAAAGAELSALQGRLHGSRGGSFVALEGVSQGARAAGRALHAHLMLVQRILRRAEQV